MERSEAKIVELDVRPYLRKKMEPFQIIMDTVKTLEKDNIFVLHATFKPTPLFGVLKMKGLVGKAEQVDKDHWINTFVNKKNKHWLEESGADTEVESDAELTAKQDTESSTTAEPKTFELDNRGLEPPQPMIRTLSTLDKANKGDTVIIHNDRVPVFLIEELNNLGYPFSVEEQEDGSAKVKITKV